MIERKEFSDTVEPFIMDTLNLHRTPLQKDTCKTGHDPRTTCKHVWFIVSMGAEHSVGSSGTG